MRKDRKLVKNWIFQEYQLSDVVFNLKIYGEEWRSGFDVQGHSTANIELSGCVEMT